MSVGSHKNLHHLGEDSLAWSLEQTSIVSDSHSLQSQRLWIGDNKLNWIKLHELTAARSRMIAGCCFLSLILFTQFTQLSHCRRPRRRREQTES